MSDPKEIRILPPMVEGEWQTKHDAFFLAATPKFYEWLSWVITLAAMSYVQHKSPSSPMYVLIGITYVLTFYYYIAFFRQFKFRGFPLLKSPRDVRLVSYILSFLLSATMWGLVNEAVRVIVATQP